MQQKSLCIVKRHFDLTVLSSFLVEDTLLHSESTRYTPERVSFFSCCFFGLQTSDWEMRELPLSAP